ncbi:MAG: TrkH family potassium uptake protein [Fimbriimonadaceae bacterium]|nr:TrkH family potassium uptake protein [Alphaproteobacteria bacterium]
MLSEMDANMYKELMPVLKVIGVLLMIMGAMMLLPGIVDLAYENDDWKVFAGSSFVSFFIGTSLMFSQNVPIEKLSTRQAILLVNLAWLGCAGVGAVPFMLAEIHLSVTDAFFESMSGITTTGSTVVTGLERLPAGILLWRAILQWIGGLGIIVTSLSILPALNIAGMQMFKIEAFDIDGKAFPRAAQISTALTSIYIALTSICALALWLSGLTGLEAVTHAMTTIATGGFSTSDSSVGYFDNRVAEAIITVGMVAGGIPFLAYVRLLQRQYVPVWKDEQIRGYLVVMGYAVLAVTLWLILQEGMGAGTALRYAAFNVASIMTGTGFVSEDYGAWGNFPVGLFLFLTLVGGCAGSTSCGIKIFRFQILLRTSSVQLGKIVFPSMIPSLKYKNRTIDQSVVSSVQSFFYLFAITLAGLTIALTATGLDLLASLSGAATALANVGPGLGEIIGPTGTFQSLPVAAKWLLACGMLIGRLEILTVYLLFTRLYWEQ